eukprot:27517-Pelagococcus_subviridis.AAC.1
MRSSACFARCDFYARADVRAMRAVAGASRASRRVRVWSRRRESDTGKLPDADGTPVCRPRRRRETARVWKRS